MDSTPGLARVRRRARGLTAIVGVAAMLALAACTPQPPTTEDGGTSITIALPTEPRTLASWLSYANDGHPVLRNMLEALVNRDPETHELVGELATSWEKVDDLTWNFTLREGVTFHDGTDFNAEAAAAGLNFVVDPDNAFLVRVYVGPEITARAVDEYTLEVKTAAPDPILPDRMFFFTIPSMAAVDADPDGYARNPVGTGPYKFVDYQPGQQIHATAFEDWWGRRAPEDAHGSNEAIKDVTFVFRPESEVRSAMIQSGEADIARWLTSEQCELAPQCESTPTVETLVVRMDMVNPVLSDIRIRQAISLSFDKDQILNGIIGGGEPSPMVIGPTVLGFNDSLEPYPYDPDEAKRLVAEAKADGVPVDSTQLYVIARADLVPRADEVIQLIGESLTAIGLNVRSEVVETATFEEQWQVGYDNIPPERGLIGLNSHGNELGDFSLSVFSLYQCASTRSAFCDQDVEKEAAAASQLSGDERDAAYQALGAYFYEQVPVVPIGQQAFHFGLSDRVDWSPRQDGLILIKEIGIK
ncbi:ABC transporter substrate-binding protein [Microbacterium ulmi]|uniref:Solute-binding protein family 5 domain-containing protein n=1 Tax=Microbacterium ulmi TaxID=179095 RepID=A0A7Y2LYK2_9MICO|nr:ABC transporter substrate-binding protein [Microbacterium ulmi]NII69837.1 peptide/nickel transport system substrate-binding protein [Microbacterium ulmi]NNH03194.1 hypothetical protein [Microbacterium ulmi]